MEATSGGDEVSPSVKRRRSSPAKTKGHERVNATATAAVAEVSPTTSKMSSDLHRSRSHEPRHTPPLFLMPTTAAVDRSSTAVPALSAPVPVRPSTDSTSGSSARLSDPGKAAEADDDVDKRSTSSTGRDTVVQLNYAGVTEVLVDGGKSIHGGGGDTAPAVAGKTAVDDEGLTGGDQGSDDGGDGPWRWSPLNLLASCYAAWLAGIAMAQHFVHGLLTRHMHHIQRALLVLVLVAFGVYLVVAIVKSGLCAIAVIVIALIGLLIQSVRLLNRFCGQRIDTYVIAPMRQMRHSKPCHYLKW